MAIAEAIEVLKEETRNWDTRYGEMVADMAAGNTPPADVLVVLSTVGKTLDAFQADCEDAAANRADVAAMAEAQRLAGCEIRIAQGVVAKLNADAQVIGGVVNAVVAELSATVQAVLEPARSHANNLFGETARLRGRLNWFSLQGRRAQIEEAEYSLRQLPKSYGDPKIDSTSLQSQIAYQSGEVAKLRAAPMQYITTSRLPPPPPAVDLYALVAAGVVDTLVKAVPGDKRVAIFTKLAEAFSSAATPASVELSDAAASTPSAAHNVD
jgi:hypothetical protein